MKETKVNVLGHKYDVILYDSKEVPEELKEKEKTANGICENYSHELIIFKSNPEPNTYKDIEKMYDKVAIHELMHAYLFKSGASQFLSKDAEEVIVDMLAINFDNIVANVNKIREDIFKS